MLSVQCALARWPFFALHCEVLTVVVGGVVYFLQGWMCVRFACVCSAASGCVCAFASNCVPSRHLSFLNRVHIGDADNGFSSWVCFFSSAHRLIPFHEQQSNLANHKNFNGTWRSALAGALCSAELFIIVVCIWPPSFNAFAMVNFLLLSHSLCVIPSDAVVSMMVPLLPVTVIANTPSPMWSNYLLLYFFAYSFRFIQFVLPL